MGKLLKLKSKTKVDEPEVKKKKKKGNKAVGPIATVGDPSTLTKADREIMKALGKKFNIDNKEKEVPYNILFAHHGLNFITGGIPGGIFIEIHGPSQCGKSYLMYELGKSVLQQGGWYYQNDIERAYKKIIGVRLGMEGFPKFIKERTENMEQCFIDMKEFVLKIRAHDKKCPIMCGVDSYPLFELNETMKEMEAELKKIEGVKKVEPRKVKGFASMKKVAKFTELIKDFLSFIEKHDVIFLLLNQERTNHGVMFGDKKTTNADQPISFACSTRIRGKLGSKIYDDKGDKKKKDGGEKETFNNKKRVIGRKVTWECLKSRHPDIPPFMSVETSIIYRSGVKPYSGLAELLVREGIAKDCKVGNSKGVSIKGKKMKLDDVVKYLENHPEIIYSAK